jgi:hypothetical protein
VCGLRASRKVLRDGPTDSLASSDGWRDSCVPLCCHHANDHPDVRWDDLLLAEEAHIREEPEIVTVKRVGRGSNGVELKDLWVFRGICG